MRPHPFKCKATAGAAVVLWLSTDKRNAGQGTKSLREEVRSAACLLGVLCLAYKAMYIKFLTEFEHRFLKISGVCQSSLILCW